jgi:DNA topoisomerase III
VDPRTTAVWEMRLDDVLVGKANFRAVIDEIAGEADRLITVLRQHNRGTVDLSQPAPLRSRRGRSKVGRRSRSGGQSAATTDAATPKSRRPRRVKNASRQQMGDRKQDGSPEPRRPTSSRPTPPTSRMVAFAERLAKNKRATLPSGYDKDFDICRRFLDQHAGRKEGLGETPTASPTNPMVKPAASAHFRAAATPSAVWGRADAPPACCPCVLVTRSRHLANC